MQPRPPKAAVRMERPGRALAIHSAEVAKFGGLNDGPFSGRIRVDSRFSREETAMRESGIPKLGLSVASDSSQPGFKLSKNSFESATVRTSENGLAKNSASLNRGKK